MADVDHIIHAGDIGGPGDFCMRSRGVKPTTAVLATTTSTSTARAWAVSRIR